MKKLNKKGFTIVELVIVIAVIAILAAVLIPTFSGIVDKANANKALQEVKNAYTATLAEDLSTETPDDDVVYNKGAITVDHENGTKITISVEGVPSVVTEGTATHTLVNGKLVAVQQQEPAHQHTDSDGDNVCDDDTCGETINGNS